MFRPQIGQSSKICGLINLPRYFVPLPLRSHEGRQFSWSVSTKKTFVTKTELNNLHLVAGPAENDFFWKGDKCLISQRDVKKNASQWENTAF